MTVSLFLTEIACKSGTEQNFDMTELIIIEHYFGEDIALFRYFTKLYSKFGNQVRFLIG